MIMMITVWRRLGDDTLNGVNYYSNYDASGDDDYKKVNDHSNDGGVVNVYAVKIFKASQLNKQGSSIILLNELWQISRNTTF